MTQNSDSFDPYQAWLEIPPEDQPPTLYRLLGIEDFESDEALIDSASKKRTAHLHQLAGGPNRELVQRLLNEVARARRTLLSAESRDQYNNRLRGVSVETPNPHVPPVVGNSGIAIAVDSPVADSARGDAKEPKKTRGKSSQKQLQLHMLSACALLLVVVCYVIYRNSQPSVVASNASAPSAGSSRTTATGSRSGRSLMSSDAQRSAFDNMLSQSQAASSPPGAATNARNNNQSPSGNSSNKSNGPAPAAKLLKFNDNKSLGTSSGDVSLSDSPIDGKAVVLAGGGACVDYQLSNPWKLGNKPFTVSLWLKPSKVTKAGILCAGGYNDRPGWLLDCLPNGTIRFEATQATKKTKSKIETEAGVLVAEKWTHVVVTADAKRNGKILVNSAEAATGKLGNFNLTNAKARLVIGTIENERATSFHGMIDQIEVWAKPLSQKEIESIFQPHEKLVAQPNANK